MPASFSYGAVQVDNRNLAATIPANADQVAYVVAAWEDTTVTGFTLGGQSMTEIAAGPWNDITNLVRVYRLIDPPTGSQTLTATGGGGVNSLVYALCVVQDAHQTTPNTTPVIDDYTDEGFSTTTDVDITATDANGLIIGVAIMGEGNVQPTPTSPLTERAAATGNGLYGRSINLATRASAASGTLTLEWTSASTNMGGVAIEVLPAPAGGGAPQAALAQANAVIGGGGS